MDSRLVNRRIVRFKHGEIFDVEDILIKEMALTIYLNSKELVTLLCTPEHMEELALGFLVSEGLIKNHSDITKISLNNEQGEVWVETSKTEIIAEKLFLKRYITTGCGKGTSFYNVIDSALIKPIASQLKLNPDQIILLMKNFQNLSQIYKETGGVHSSALGTAEKILIFREDIGRHNAVDKIVGECFKKQINLDNKILVTSGRISSEILLKVAKMGISILISRSAPTDYAIRLAEETGVTIVGFVRGERFNIYSHQERVQGASN